MTNRVGRIGISIVTPSFNRVRFLKDAMDSVINQAYPNLEYVVVDGGSKDGSAELIEGYSTRLTSWSSEPDLGQYYAINKGFARTTGEVMGWLNSDDLHLPWALSVVADLFEAFPQVEWVTSAFPLIWNERGQAIACSHRQGYSKDGFRRGEYLPTGKGYSTGFIQQESTFWRRSLWERVGGNLDISYRVAADFDLWMRFSEHAELHAIEVPLAGYRIHGEQRTVKEKEEYLREAEKSLRLHGGRHYTVSESLAMRAAASLPRTVRRWANRAGVLPRRPVCVRPDPTSGWRIDYR